MVHQQRMLGVPATMVLMAAILIPAHSVAAVFTPPSEPLVPVIELAAGSVVTIGNGSDSQGAFNGTDEMPFLSALAALPEGGQIHVGPGTYVFRTPINISGDDVLIRGDGATLLSSAQVAVGLFDVTGDDVRLESLELVDHLPSRGHSLIRVAAQRFELIDCVFRGRDARGASPTFVELLSRLFAPRSSARIAGNEFHPHRGWTIVQGETLQDLQFDRNTVMGNAIGERRGRGFLAYGLRLEDVNDTIIEDNVFLQLGDTQNPVQAAIEVTGGSVGQVLTVDNNIFHTITAHRALHLRGARNQTVSRNAFGSMLGAGSIATVDVDATPQGLSDTEGPGAMLEGNRFHGTGGGPALRLNGGRGHVVLDNRFEEAGLVSVLAGDETPAQGVNLLNNEFTHRGEEGAGRHGFPAILLLGGAGHVVQRNSLHNYEEPGVVVEGR